jgi:hypothetical protein
MILGSTLQIGRIRYGELSTVLHTAGYALPHLPSYRISRPWGPVLQQHASGERDGNPATSIDVRRVVCSGLQEGKGAGFHCP